MNEIVAILYEYLFNWNVYQELLGMVFNNLDYGKIGWLLIIVPIVLLTVFYKLWDPVNLSKLKWFIVIAIITLIAYGSTSAILYNNSEIIEYLGNYTGENGEPDADYFIFQMSIISMVYALIISFISSLAFFRLLSSNNSHNPF